MPASKGDIVKRPITIAGLSALVLSSAFAVQVTAASGESKDTQCWDVYNLRCTRKSSTVAPTGLSTGDCTPGIGCYHTYRASDGKRTTWAVPYGIEPKNACSPDVLTPVTVATTTNAAPTTTAAPTTAAVAGGPETTAAASPSQVAPGATVKLSVTMRSDVGRNDLVDIEAYRSSGEKVFQFWWDNQSFATGESKTLSTNWTVPPSLAPGTYTLKIGVFGAGWSPLVAWNDAAGTMSVSPASTTTSPPMPTTTSVPPSSSGRFATLPVGAALPSGAECATRVRPSGEVRPENAAANSRRGSRANANTRNDWSQFTRVDGDFAGSTDEIIQWAACKWGIDEDIARAQVIKESYWFQSVNSDNGESWGLGQVRDTAHQSAFQYSVNARTSAAYNLDYTYATWRACYEGVYTWLNTVERNGNYGAGDVCGVVSVFGSVAVGTSVTTRISISLVTVSVGITTTRPGKPLPSSTAKRFAAVAALQNLRRIGE